MHSTVQAMLDPFEEPVFNMATQASQAVDSQVALSSGGQTELVVYAVAYCVGMALLTYWDESVLPKLQRRGLMPIIPGSLEDIRQKREAVMKVPWVTPLTIDRNMNLPPLEALYRKAHRVGRTFVDELGQYCVQYIRAHPRLKGEVKPSSILMQLEQTATPVPIPVRQEGDDLITDEV